MDKIEGFDGDFEFMRMEYICEDEEVIYHDGEWHKSVLHGLYF